MEERLTDIDYAVLAVKKSLQEKFGRDNDLGSLELIAGKQTILVRDGPNEAEGTRDKLLAGIRAAPTYADVWLRWRGE